MVPDYDEIQISIFGGARDLLDNWSFSYGYDPTLLIVAPESLFLGENKASGF
jgi:hypothetical protein